MARVPYKQGFFTPVHPDKYKGSLPIVYRSKLELNLLRWADKNPNVVYYGSETVVIPYQSPLDGKIHRYFTDMNMTLKNPQTGKITKYVIEVKPYKQVFPPDPKRTNKKSLYRDQLEYAKNLSKWNAAKAWCEHSGHKFIILTEKNLANLNS